uniref:Uncharacterized protein n=1 Tax=Aegilops tauschii subsp. strangulata TaxID=200361 RepID=A0A453PX80_AEGTS
GRWNGFVAEERRVRGGVGDAAGQHRPGGQGEAGSQAQEPERICGQEAPQHGKPPAPGPVEHHQRPPGEGHGRGGEHAAARGVHEERRRPAVQLGPEEGAAAAGGVRGVPGGVPGGGRAGAPPLRAPLPLGLRRALGPGRLPLPLLPRRRPPRRPPASLACVNVFPAGAAACAGPADQLIMAPRWSRVAQYSRHLRMHGIPCVAAAPRRQVAVHCCCCVRRAGRRCRLRTKRVVVRGKTCPAMSPTPGVARPVDRT